MKRQAKSSGNIEFLENNDRISAETEEIQSRIRQRAFEISETRGHSGREMDDWLSAESEIISVPPIELSEKGNTFQLQLAVAGLNRADLRVMATPEQMLIKADFRHDHASSEATVHVCEFKSATVFRSITFPEPIDPKSIKVDFEDGLVRITAQKAAGAVSDRPTRRRSPATTASRKRPKAKAS